MSNGRQLDGGATARTAAAVTGSPRLTGAISSTLRRCYKLWRPGIPALLVDHRCGPSRLVPGALSIRPDKHTHIAIKLIFAMSPERRSELCQFVMKINTDNFRACAGKMPRQKTLADGLIFYCLAGGQCRSLADFALWSCAHQ